MPTVQVFHNVVLHFSSQYIHCIWGYPCNQCINSYNILNVLDLNIMSYLTA